MKILNFLYYTILLQLFNNPLIRAYVYICHESRTVMPVEYYWTERYYNRIEYWERRQRGIKCTYKDVENEYLEEWTNSIREAMKKHEEYLKEFKKNNPPKRVDYDWWD